MARLTVAVLAVGIAACSSGEDRAALCEAISKTPEAALQPRDLVFWEKNCPEQRARATQEAAAASRRQLWLVRLEICIASKRDKARSVAEYECSEQLSREDRPNPGRCGNVWSGPCRLDTECTSCRCVSGECARP